MKVGTDGVLLGAWASGGRRMLDVGTGTGVIALMLAQRYPEACVDAIDIDADAAAQAARNAALSPFADRVQVICRRVQDHQGCYDAIVSNPPYFIDSLQAPDRQRSLARHADTLSYRDLMEAAWRLLADDGQLSVVVPFDYRQRMADEAIFRGFFASRLCAVRTTPAKPPRRYLMAFGKHPCACQQQELVIGSPDYRALTDAFYL